MHQSKSDATKCVGFVHCNGDHGCGGTHALAKEKKNCEQLYINYLRDVKKRKKKGYTAKCPYCKLLFATLVDRSAHQVRCKIKKRRKKVSPIMHAWTLLMGMFPLMDPEGFDRL